jgi:hypothetical protein
MSFESNVYLIITWQKTIGILKYDGDLAKTEDGPSQL